MYTIRLMCVCLGKKKEVHYNFYCKLELRKGIHRFPFQINVARKKIHVNCEDIVQFNGAHKKIHGLLILLLIYVIPDLEPIFF